MPEYVKQEPDPFGNRYLMAVEDSVIDGGEAFTAGVVFEPGDFAARFPVFDILVGSTHPAGFPLIRIDELGFVHLLKSQVPVRIIPLRAAVYERLERRRRILVLCPGSPVVLCKVYQLSIV